MSLFCVKTITSDCHILQAGKLLRAHEFEFDLAYTSVLKRTIKSLEFILEELEQVWIPVEKSWRLNERHYGDLQGRNKADTAKKYGDRQVQVWRRSYNSTPARKAADNSPSTCVLAIWRLTLNTNTLLASSWLAPCHFFPCCTALELGKDDPRYPGNDRRYALLDSSDLPMTESLKTTVERVVPLWEASIGPAISSGKRIVVVAHGNSIRVNCLFLMMLTVMPYQGSI